MKNEDGPAAVLAPDSKIKQYNANTSRKRKSSLRDSGGVSPTVVESNSNGSNGVKRSKKQKSNTQLTLDSLGWTSSISKNTADTSQDSDNHSIVSDAITPVSEENEHKSLSSVKAKIKPTTYFSQVVEVAEPEDLPWAEESELNPNQPEKDPEKLENDPRIPQIVMFQRQFSKLFFDVPCLGPQDIEEGISESGTISWRVEALMVRLMSLVLNRKKKMIEPGRYKRSLEEVGAFSRSVGGFGSKWPQDYNIKRGVVQLDTDTKLEYLRLLTLWALTNSQDVRAEVNSEDFEVVGPENLGCDTDGNTYWLVEGINTCFRVYKESSPRLRHVSWRSVAGNIEELQQLKQELESSSESTTKPASEEAQSSAAGIAEKIEHYISSKSQREKDIEKSLAKDLVREEMRRDTAEALERARNGEGRYSGRTRGVKVNYFVEYNENDEINGYDGVADEDDFYEENVQDMGSLRGSRRSARLQTSET